MAYAVVVVTVTEFVIILAISAMWGAQIMCCCTVCFLLFSLTHYMSYEKVSNGNKCNAYLE